MEQRRVRITAGTVVLEGQLEDNAVAGAFWDALPIDGPAQIWGDEIYFRIPVDAPVDERSERETVDLGTIGFWPPENALCLFFGPTPMSSGDEIRPASSVNVIGKLAGDSRELKGVPAGAKVTVHRV